MTDFDLFFTDFLLEFGSCILRKLYTASNCLEFVKTHLGYSKSNKYFMKYLPRNRG